METTPNLPTSLQEAILYFADKDRALAFMVNLRWKGDVSCPYCGSRDHRFMAKYRRWNCNGCKKQFTVKVGTVMEASPLGLDKWLCVIWLVANAKNGISSYEVHRALGVTQKTAWFLLHRVRLAMQNGSLEKLSGEVEVDETFIGGKARNMHKEKREAAIQGRGAVGKTIVMGLLERGKDGGVSTVRATVVPNTKKATMHEEVRKHVEPGSMLYTDTNASYDGLNPDYAREVVCQPMNTPVGPSLRTGWRTSGRC